MAWPWRCSVPDMLFRILHDERSGDLTYLLADLDAREAVLVDPRRRDLAVLAALLAEQDLRLCQVLRTHEHDALFPGEFDALVRLGAPIVQGAPRAGAQLPADGELLPFGNEHLRVLATPGHTRHCLSFLWRDRLFCGGLLAVDACPHQALALRPTTPPAIPSSQHRAGAEPLASPFCAGLARRISGAGGSALLRPQPRSSATGAVTMQCITTEPADPGHNP